MMNSNTFEAETMTAIILENWVLLMKISNGMWLMMETLLD